MPISSNTADQGGTDGRPRADPLGDGHRQVSPRRLYREFIAAYVALHSQLRRRSTIGRTRHQRAHALRSNQPPLSSGRRSTLAREKNTSRAAARRRTRVTLRADQIAGEEYHGAEGPEFVDSVAPPEPERKPLFKIPNVREDLRALPSMFRTRRMLWVPLLLLIGGLGVVMAYPGLSPDMQGLASYYIQFFFAPPALFTFFMAGFFAPRASYLAGAVYGLIAGIFWAIAFSGVLPNTVPSTAAPVDPLMSTFASLAYGLLFGTLAGALAGWYRDFLRGIQERGKARRAVKEVDERAKRREERQEARRTAKRPTS